MLSMSQVDEQIIKGIFLSMLTTDHLVFGYQHVLEQPISTLNKKHRNCCISTEDNND